jgi:hypothetical protein
MSVPIWQAATFYNPGATVRRVSAPITITSPPFNPGFESGNTGWDLGAGWVIQNRPGEAFAGSWVARFKQNTISRIVNQNAVAVTPGQTITASCYVRQGNSVPNQAGGRIEIDWFDSGMVLISTSQGNDINSGPTTAYFLSTVTASAPAGAAFAKVAGRAFRNSGDGSVRMDNFTWDYSSQVDVGGGLVFTAVQPSPGFSGASEPVWPDTVGQQVVDNEVIWEALESSLVVWEAVPILVSGSSEPAWPDAAGSTAIDNTIVWEAVPRRVTDERCPNTAVVAIAASKIFCADNDIIGYSATVNPLDWSTRDDAGYLPFGLQTYGANPVLALGLYRGNLIAFNSTGFQMWQVDEDPVNMALLDAVPISCTQPRSLQPVMNDLVFLSAVGVRNISIAGASTNLQAGTFGEAVDPLVQARLREFLGQPHATVVPALGQYWLFFGAEAFVLTINGTKDMSWSRYLFPEEITDTTLLDNDLILRTATNKLWRVVEGQVMDDYHCE